MSSVWNSFLLHDAQVSVSFICYPILSCMEDPLIVRSQYIQ